MLKKYGGDAPPQAQWNGMEGTPCGAGHQKLKIPPGKCPGGSLLEIINLRERDWRHQW